MNINLKQNDDCYVLNGVTMTASDLQIYMGIHGYYVDKNLSKMNFYFKALATLVEIPYNQFVRSLEQFSRFSEEDKQSIAEIVEIKRKMVENLTEDSNFLVPH